ncbi:DUF6545 domain-containing protein [Streptomyces malaysiensis]|uniref:DUF6545 domain-containing protein n=1 Tax=Streptomyces malaysiensis TaxID=92644 RepID=UPI0035ADF0E3
MARCVALVQPESARVRQALRPRAPLALQAHRRTIETYDAILDLQAWGQPGPYERARTYAQQIGVSGEQLEATVLAGALWQARAAGWGREAGRARRSSGDQERKYATAARDRAGLPRTADALPGQPVTRHQPCPPSRRRRPPGAESAGEA